MDKNIVLEYSYGTLQRGRGWGTRGCAFYVLLRNPNSEQGSWVLHRGLALVCIRANGLL